MAAYATGERRWITIGKRRRHTAVRLGILIVLLRRLPMTAPSIAISLASFLLPAFRRLRGVVFPRYCVHLLQRSGYYSATTVWS
jgi:hypothetical protein